MSNSENKDFESKTSRPVKPDPNRFKVSKATLIIDSLMNKFILVGGLGVIVAVFGIFFFIFGVVVPLFQSAKVEFQETIPTSIKSPIIIGTDEWSERPFVLEKTGEIHFIDTTKKHESNSIQLKIPESAEVTAYVYLQEAQTIYLGLSNGKILEVAISYKPKFHQDGTREIKGIVSSQKLLSLKNSTGKILHIDGVIDEEKKTIAAIVESETGTQVYNQSYERKRSLFGKSNFKLNSEALIFEGRGTEKPTQVLVGSGARRILIRKADDSIAHFAWNDSDFELAQNFKPFPNESIASMEFIQGLNSISLISDSGKNIIYNIHRIPETGHLEFEQIKELKATTGIPTFFARSSRNKAYLIGSQEELSLRYLTTGKIRWQSDNKWGITHSVINGKFDRLVSLNSDNDLVLFSLNDPHPEAGFAAFFSKIWYEGQSEPKYTWQSTGGSDDFEPKLSLIPLIFGSLKGTLYALLFSVPIAILAAIYTSQFLSPSLKKVIKPTMEIMASLPSVVLGFLGALWLAPILEDRIPSLIISLTAIPLSAVTIGYLWNLLPIQYRIMIPKGWEFVIFVPTLIIISYVTWQMGPAFERLAFTVTDAETGRTVADFRLWWESFSGNQFQQRNSVIIGFMMGFAVIPIIYTITEDAMSAVPPALTSGSLALGASRWQTTARVVLPTAFAGIFSAFMIGLGRAVGETMIVVMATGNTAIMDLDIFNGMRTLSANIAVELPEAPHNGTLYRTLFLGAFVLFVMTFFINTVAEILRARIRDRFKVVG